MLETRMDTGSTRKAAFGKRVPLFESGDTSDTFLMGNGGR
jgi:hypothetical protein